MKLLAILCKLGRPHRWRRLRKGEGADVLRSARVAGPDYAAIAVDEWKRMRVCSRCSATRTAKARKRAPLKVAA